MLFLSMALLQIYGIGYIAFVQLQPDDWTVGAFLHLIQF